MHIGATIAALATPSGGALAIIRVSGDDAVTICDRIFVSPKGKSLCEQKANTVHFGELIYDGEIIDQVVVTIFRAPYSYTGENMVEISAHGSSYISSRIIEVLCMLGASVASAGEFTMRAFMNGKMDLTQAEAVADLISAESKAAHDVAINQIRGGYSHEFSLLHDQLLEICSLLELELDFGEEDVEFADRDRLSSLLEQLKNRTFALKNSFQDGNVIKNGVPVAIIGRPNVGKSTLLNRLLNDDRAIVSEIAGTTRDVIEETITINGILYRLIDTAGMRESADKLEQIGIERSFNKLAQASVVLLVADISDSADSISEHYFSLNILDEQHIAILLNKCDCLSESDISARCSALSDRLGGLRVLALSAKYDFRISALFDYLGCLYGGRVFSDCSVVTNVRHYEMLCLAYSSLLSCELSVRSCVPTDLITEDLRQVLHSLGLITGSITTDDILSNIFSKFCIGK